MPEAFMTAALRARHAMKPFEDAGQCVRRNAGAGIAHREFGVSGGLPQRDLNLSVERELERVGYKIQDDLLLMSRST